MNMMSQPDLHHLLLRARESEVGVSVVTNNPKILKAKLYAVRKEFGFTDLSFAQPPVDGDSRLWIIKKGAKDDGERED
jgi:hypothetical protein